METVNASGLVSQVFLRCVEDCFEPIMLTNRTGQLTYVNPAWCRAYGFAKEEALGQTPRLLRSSYQDENFYRAMWQTIQDPKIGFWRGEVTNKARDGHLVPVLLTITPYREGGHEIIGYMGIAIDLSEQKQMEQQILRQDRLASIGMLAGGLAHEIGNPLGVIRGRAEMVMRQLEAQPGAKKDLEVIVSQIDRISGLIQSLLRVSRVPEQVLLREVPLAPVASEVLTLMGDTCRGLGIELKLKDLDKTIYAEPSQMQQIFLNLVINAMHAIEERKAKTTSLTETGNDTTDDFIEISADHRENSCVVSIRDSGCGISQENIQKLFRPFYTTKSAGKGTGLGLAIVSKLVEEMGGKISVESEGVGRGATFKVAFKTPGPLASSL